MLNAAEKRLAEYENVTLINADYGQHDWQKNLQSPISSLQFDVIVSGYSIHHQPDERKRELYAELYDLLRPGGIFINMEHVASQSAWGERLYDELFMDAIYSYQQQQGNPQTRAEIADSFNNRPDKEANILAPVETQCDWLRDIGFKRVDCYQKLFELAVFGGTRPR